jgi:hypothetical protein
VSGGLSFRQLGALLKEHGSYAAAIEARPDLADELRAAEQNSERLARGFRKSSVRMYEQMVANRERYEKMAASRFEKGVAVHETALARHAETQPHQAAAHEKRPGAKSRWRKVDLEMIFVKHPTMPARELARSGFLVETIHHQRISEVRKRGDIRVENGRLLPPPGTLGDGGWVTLPKPR